MSEAIKAVHSPREKHISAPSSVVMPKRDIIHRHRTLDPAALEAPSTADVLKSKVDVLIRKRSQRGQSVDKLDKVNLPPVISRNNIHSSVD
jgi:hypothetical protein